MLRNIFDPLYLSKEAKAHLNDWENKAYNLRMEISELEKQIHGMKMVLAIYRLVWLHY